MAVTRPLADVLLATIDSPAREVLAEAKGLEADLGSALAEAREKWTSVHVSDAEVVAYIADRIPEDIDDRWGITDLHTSDLYVACAAARGDNAAVSAIQARYFGDLTAALIHAGASRTAAEEIEQALLVKLFVGSPERLPRITGYMGRGDLYSWIRVTAIRMLHTAARKQGREHTLDSAVAAQLEAPDENARRLQARYHAEFKAAIRDALAELTARERNLLRHQILDRLSIDQIGQLYDVHRATAARWLQKARTQLATTTRTALRRRLEITGDELDSVLHLIESQLEASLPRLLGDGAGPS